MIENAIFHAYLNTDYYISYEDDAIPIGGLPIGTLVIEPFREWEFRNKKKHIGTRPIKLVTWTVVAKDNLTRSWFDSNGLTC